jgi:hypothetical protein
MLVNVNQIDDRLREQLAKTNERLAANDLDDMPNPVEARAVLRGIAYGLRTAIKIVNETPQFQPFANAQN